VSGFVFEGLLQSLPMRIDGWWLYTPTGVEHF
jgi:hypothetical protein